MAKKHSDRSAAEPAAAAAAVAGEERRGKNGQGKGGRDKGGLALPAFHEPRLPRATEDTYTPFLLIQSAVGDFGARPLPSGAVFWESPAVWTVGSQGVNQPVPGEPTAVFARVANLGREQANGVVVRFWWADPSLAITESTAHEIGMGFTNIPAGQSRVVQCPQAWVPVVENGGHECLLAEAFVPHFDPLTAPMDPVLDRHVGQKNEQLLIVEQGKKFTLRLQAANAAPVAQPITIDVLSHRGATVPRLIAARIENEQARLAPSAQLPIALEVRDDAGPFVPASASYARRLLSFSEAQAGGDAEACSPLPWLSHSLALDAWESRTLKITGTVPEDAPVGQTYLFRIVQRAGPIVLGGYTVAIVAAAA
jgi:hypothetical protein